MRSLYKFIVLFITVVLISHPTMYAQGEDISYVENAATAAKEQQQQSVIYNSKEPTTEQWQKATADKAFGYKNEVEFKKMPVPAKPPQWLLILAAIFAFFASTAGKIILFVLLAAILGYVVYRIIAGEGRLFAKESKSVNETGETTINEEDLLTNNWETRLKAAIDTGDNRLAIRYSYMLLLQLLQNRNLIHYRQDKTNIEYFRELTDDETKQAFRKMMRQYEYTWYGNFLPSGAAFDEYFNTFNGLKNKLKSW